MGATEGAAAIVLAGTHAGSDHQRGAILVLLLIILVIWCFN
ncbi:hypothetical protein [Pseudonocardia acaciae]|nr:hypothetical protein [Pseudonocardia acaciae]